MKRSILLIITGSIAAYKSVELIRLLTKDGFDVRVILTKSAEQFIGKLTIETISHNKVYDDIFESSDSLIDHIALSRGSDLIVVAPATANFIGKIANGIADDLASNIVMARSCDMIIAPAMNVKMWENIIVQKNINALREGGVNIIQPQSDILACGEEGYGKMAESQTIFDEIAKQGNIDNFWKDKKVIVTLGATIEKIDAVRYISNFSSGKQGMKIAKELAGCGAQVEVIAGNCNCEPYSNINIAHADSAESMLCAIENKLPADIFISTAAICDFKPKISLKRKIKKEEGLRLEFMENVDVLKTISSLPEGKRPNYIVGFAAESDNEIENGKKKLIGKKCDMIVANNIAEYQVFGGDKNKVHFITKDEILSTDMVTKREVAKILMKKIRDTYKA